ncbi:SAM-dependent methyltransferase [Helicobacter sp. L8]|uniref:SAM-dependent methyltransferase n=1 Tax=Helicobacter sp. L8 TaxID=2316078 RepID=UPI0019694B8C|nr:SAM-dependent methyltransferase [Helicobacter sp. L8]
MERSLSFENPKPFSALMSHWLYGHGGYYTRARVGRGGDFYTAVSASAFFGGTLAFYLLDLLEKGQLTLPLSVVEIGAHGGQLLGDVLSFLRALSSGVLEQVRWITLEPLAHLRALQQAYLAQRGITLQCISRPLELPTDTNLFVYCNELWDSFPCEVVQGGKMLYIARDFTPLWRDTSLLEGCAPLWQEYTKDLTQALKRAPKWILVSFDYGQYGKLDRVDLRAYWQHRVLDFTDILEHLATLYQRTDLTYDVDFKHLECLLSQQGACSLFYGTQAKALVNMGLLQLLELFKTHMPFNIYQREALKARALVDPSAFGERFKALIVASFAPG